MNHPLILIVIGLVVGVYSGILGLGGGTIMIPIMIFLLALTPKQAIGTSLAIMLPALIPAVLEHYRTGNVKLSIGVWIAIGMAVGGYFGARIVALLHADAVRLIFGFVVVFVAAYTIYGKESAKRGLLLAGIVLIVAAILFVGSRWYDGRFY